MASQKKCTVDAEENGGIWNDLCVTPAEYTKPFTKPGGFRGKSIDPVWRIMKLTERFGPVGQGWRFIQEDQWSETSPEAVVVYVRGRLEYKQDEEWYPTMSHTGGTTVNAKQCDEAYKMAETDALGKCCLDLGMAADLYLGLHDGDKYQGESGSPRAPMVPRSKSRPPAGKTQPLLDEIEVIADVEAELSEIKSLKDDPAAFAYSRLFVKRLIASKDLTPEQRTTLAEAVLIKCGELVAWEMLPNYKKQADFFVKKGWVTAEVAEKLTQLAEVNQ